MSASADVCLLLEGTYPFVSGGVSSWVHSLLLAHPDLRFHLVCLTPDDRPRQQRFQPPDNVLSLTCIPLQSLPTGTRRSDRKLTSAVHEVLALVDRLLTGTAGLDDLSSMARHIDTMGGMAGRALLLDSRIAFAAVRSSYERSGANSSFLDYFWSWRSLASAVLAVLLPQIPEARCYHAVSTGFAGLLGARLAATTGRKLILTEHGIYTNERRIEIAMADWLYQGPEASFAPRKTIRDLRDLWIEAFEGFARLAYEASDPIVTLYRGNQRLQLRDGAMLSRCTIIPNGVDFDHYAAIARNDAARPPTVALIGRVVPIKDVKTFIRAIGLLRRQIPDAQGEILGPLDEDPAYAAECAGLIRQLGLEDAVTLRGGIKVLDWLGRIDINVLTSISEAQPLTILEAGAAGVPCVATDVGACREMIEGNPPGEPPFGPGGAITPVANPAASAAAIGRLLADPLARADAGEAMRSRVRARFLKSDCDRAYHTLYERAVALAAGIGAEMAGIGFVLRRLTRRDDLAGALQAFTAAAAITSGPWLLTVLAIAGSGFGGAFSASPAEYQTFRIILSYDFCFSLVLTAPATTLASRLVADQLFAERIHEIIPTYLGTLVFAVVLQLPLATLFWLFYVDVTWAEAAAAIACYAALVSLWVTTAFLSVLRDFAFVVLCFVFGMAVACGGSLLAGQFVGGAGMLACFATGISLVGFAGAGRLFTRFPYGVLLTTDLVAAARRNRVLLLIGLLSAAAPWADKWVMWFGPSSERLANGLRDAPFYDSAMFLSYLAMVPGSAAFFVIAETGFFLSYRRFFDEVLSGASLPRIESQRRELCRRIADAGVSLILLQTLVTVAIELAGPLLVRAGMLSAIQYPIFRFGVLGAQFHLLLNCLLVVMSYLDLRADQVACAAIFLLLNAGLTAGLLPFGSELEGYGYFLAGLLAFLFAALLTASRCRDLIYVAFIRNNASIRDVR